MPQRKTTVVSGLGFGVWGAVKFAIFLLQSFLQLV